MRCPLKLTNPDSIPFFRDAQANAYGAGVYGKDSFAAKTPEGDEIIRCRDCKHFQMGDELFYVCSRGWKVGYSYDTGHDEILFVEVDPDGFCKWAERRSDDDASQECALDDIGYGIDDLAQVSQELFQSYKRMFAAYGKSVGMSKVIANFKDPGSFRKELEDAGVEVRDRIGGAFNV